MFDICFDYEQRNLNSRSTPTVPSNNFRIFTFPNVTGKKIIENLVKRMQQQQSAIKLRIEKVRV